LVGVNIEGTGANSFRGAGYTAAGKTGTAQVVTIAQNEKYNAARMAERLRDHALYMAFAPADNPQIALAMVVENAGFGGVNAAPIARRVFDYWLLQQYPSEQDMAAVQKAQAPIPIGTPRKIADVPGLPGAASPTMPASAPAVPASAPLAAAPVPATVPKSPAASAASVARQTR
jgi:penicillin-binding protein 2